MQGAAAKKPAQQPAQHPGHAAHGLADLEAHMPMSSSHAPPAHPEQEPEPQMHGWADHGSSRGRIKDADIKGQDDEDNLGYEFAALRARESSRRSVSPQKRMNHWERPCQSSSE